MAAIGGTIGKTTEIAKVLPRSLSAGQIAAISISITVIIIGGFAAYAYFTDRESSEDDDDDDTWMRSLRQWIARKVRHVEGKLQRRRAVPSDGSDEIKLVSDPDKEPELEKNSGVGFRTEAGGLTGSQELPWDEKYLPPAR
ncbi:hypothetical protein B0H67DRAFT_679523 [Lasiosphaeris hirsuta]|uniref:Uncharacterized protein n=1 Tax=Lasiosphaeris hirsuta TaxID=260670 RepID=A0AA40BDJ7_9PEZI|nr:hypothetical protein B0H67DRAFT_679523 [Lasiosphaeris hirsuta]